MSRASSRTILLLAVVSLWSAALLPAHEKFRVIGVLADFRSDAIQVKDKNGKLTSIRINKQTALMRDQKKLDISELKSGMSVVVDAHGDSEAALVATEVRVVPAIGGSKDAGKPGKAR